MATKYDCVDEKCRKQVTATKNQRYRTHTNADGDPCGMSSEPIPEHVLAQPVGDGDAPDVPREGVDFAPCKECGRGAVKLTKLGYFEPHNTTLRGGERCVMSGVRFRREETVESPLLTEPGTTNSPKVRDSATPAANRGIALPVGTGSVEAGPRAEAAVAASEGVSATGLEEPGRTNLERQPMPATAEPALVTEGTSAPPTGFGMPEELGLLPTEPSPESTSTSPPSPPPEPPTPDGTSSDAPPEEGEPASAGPFSLAPLLGDGSVLQPFSHISQPFPVPPRVTLKEAMGDEGKERAARFKEIFYSYNNRRSSDNRSAQTTLGPSEIGYECDRRLAMSLMGVEPVNPGGDGWAAWLGTQGHTGLDAMFTWASANSGRFLTETRVRFESQYVPHGTADLFDRVLSDVGDFKFLGEYSLKKMIQNGPPEHYQIQLHVYGLGMELLGEKVRTVTLYGLPRAGSSLDGMYVWSVPYDRKKAKAALERVEKIAADVGRMYGQAAVDGSGPTSRMDAAAEFPTGPAAECRFCPFHLKSDKEMRRGCPGK